MNNLDLIDEDNDKIKLFFQSFLFWIILFGVLQEKLYLPNQRNRIVSILHGQIAVWTSLYYIICSLFIIYPNLEYKLVYTQKNTHYVQFMLLTHSGYFAYDTVVCIYYNLYDSWLIFHHITTLLTLITSIFQGVSGTLIMGLIYSIYILPVGLVYIEAPNLPMHFRIILRKTGKRHTKIYETLELSYFFIFILLRGTFAPVTLIHIWRDINIPIMIKFTGSALFIQTLYYFFEMKQILKTKFRQFDERKKRNISLFWFTVNPELEQLSYPKYEKLDIIL